MKPTVFLRVASVLTFLHAVLHTIGGVFGKVPAGPAAVAVAAMKFNQFPVMGHMRSFWEFYRGLGLATTISLTCESIIFWQLASLAKSGSHQLRPILFTFSIAYAALAVNSHAYFFFGPVVAEILIVACLSMAILTARAPDRSFSVAAQQV